MNVVTHSLVAQEVHNVGVTIGGRQMKRGALVVVTGVGRHAIVDEQLYIGCITIHTGLEEGPCTTLTVGHEVQHYELSLNPFLHRLSS